MLVVVVVEALVKELLLTIVEMAVQVEQVAAAVAADMHPVAEPAVPGVLMAGLMAEVLAVPAE